MIIRFLKSFSNVSSNHFKCNLRYKTNLFFNSITKVLKSFGFSLKFNIWKYSDCIFNVKFGNVSFRFFCPKSTSFNLFMNPYFHEYDILKFISRSLEKGDIFIDVGAMGGLYTIIASKLIGNNGKVFSIEPNPECINILQKNVKLNNLNNTIIYKNAVGEKNIKIKLYYDKETLEFTSIFKHKRESYFETDMYTLDSIVKGEQDIKIIKIDTEGCDEKVIEGAIQILKKTKCIIIETNNDKLRRSLKQLGFYCETLKPSGYLKAFKR